MDVCPKCGGTQRVRPEFGVWECTTPVHQPYITEFPDLNLVLAPGAYGTRAELVDRWVPCGTRYPDTTPYTRSTTQSCHCGLFAVGICGECGNPVCGPHSQLLDGILTCDRCTEKAMRAAAADEAAKARLANEELCRAWEAEETSLQAQRAEAAERGEPLEVEAAAREMIGHVLESLRRAGFPHAERFAATATTGRKERVESWLSGYYLWQGPPAQSYSSDWAGPTKSPPDYWLTTEGTIVSVGRTSEGVRSNRGSIATGSASLDSQDYVRAAMIIGFKAADLHLQFSVPWVLTTAHLAGRRFAQLRARLDQS